MAPDDFERLKANQSAFWNNGYREGRLNGILLGFFAGCICTAVWLAIFVAR